MKTAFSDCSPVEKRIVLWLLTIHVGVALGLALTMSATASETDSLALTDGGVIHTLRSSVLVERHPPVYFTMLAAWKQLAGDRIFAARLLSIGFSCCTLLTLALVSRKYLPRLHAPRTVAVAALHPFAIWSATAAQPYSLVLFISALQLLTFYEGFLQGNDFCARDEELRRCRWRVAFLVLSVIGLYTHFAIALILVATGGVLLIHSRWRSAVIYTITAGFAAACFAPMAFAIAGQTSVTDSNAVTTSSTDVSEAVMTQVATLLFPVSLSPTATQLTVSTWAWRCLAVAVPLIVLWKFRAVTFWRQNMTSIALLAVPVVAILVVGSAFNTNHSNSALLFIPALLASFALVSTCGGNRAVGWWSCAVVCFSLNAQLHDFTTRPDSEPASHVSQLQQSKRPTQ